MAQADFALYVRAVTRLGEHRVDLAVVGAGIVGLAHAVLAVERGLAVAIVERDSVPSGASVRNFGHSYLSAQTGDGLVYARKARERWLRLAAQAGFWARETGTLLVARWPEELAVIREFAAASEVPAEVLDADAALAKAPLGDGVVGALSTPADVRVDPRGAVPAIAAWLENQPGVTIHWRTDALELGDGVLGTNRGELHADAIVVAAGHDLEWLLPEVSEAAGIERCTLQMLRLAAPGRAPIEPALATGLSLPRYPAFAECASLPALRQRFTDERPELLEHGVNLLVAQQPDGTLILGDTHHYGSSARVFRAEHLDELMLDETRRLLGAEQLTVQERWLGVYPFAPEAHFLVARTGPKACAVAVTSGVGMTTSFGLAEHVLDDLPLNVHALV